MLAFELNNDRWHAEVGGLTQEQAQTFVSTGVFEDYEFQQQEYNADEVIKTFLRLRFKKDTKDCDKAMEKGANAIGYSYDALYPPYPYELNENLLRLENIGDAAKGQNVQIFALFYVFILFVIFCSRLVIDTAFEISSKEREKQFGILQSIGASKKQIAAIMTWEGGFLSLVGIPLGLLSGLGASYLLYLGVSSSKITENLTWDESEVELIFSVSPLFLLVVAVTGLVWVLLSAYGTGIRAAKMSPVEAIRSRGAAVKKIKRRSVFALVFGWTGRLASRNIRRGKKRFIITVVSVMLSMTLFVSFVYVIDILVAQSQAQYEVYEYDFAISENDYEQKKVSYRQINTLLNESGYFDNVVCSPDSYVFVDTTAEIVSSDLAEYNKKRDKDRVRIRIQFVDEVLYKRIMGDDPPVPYSQLSQQNGYVLMNCAQIRRAGNIDKEAQTLDALNVSKGETVTVHKAYNVTLDEPIVVEYEDEYGKHKDKIYEQEKIDDMQIKILDITQESNGIIESYADSLRMIGTFDQYDKYFYSYDVIENDFKSLADVTMNMLVTADLKEDADYDKAMEFLKKNDLQAWSDVYAPRLVALSRVVMVKMIGYTLLALISLIAVINLVNVISTGIINRRPEMATMKSLGMSRRQLVKMTLIECGQYVAVSGVIAIAVSELLLYLTTQSMNLFKLTVEERSEYIDYSKPIIYVLIAMAAAFVCAAAATVLPLRRIEKSSITDEIKRID